VLNRSVKGQSADVKLALPRRFVQGGSSPLYSDWSLSKILSFFFCTNCSYFDFSVCVFCFNSSRTGGVSLSY
jgi:hypothetical protein